MSHQSPSLGSTDPTLSENPEEDEAATPLIALLPLTEVSADVVVVSVVPDAVSESETPVDGNGDDPYEVDLYVASEDPL